MAGFVDVDRTGLQKAVFALVFSKAKRRSQQKRDQQKMSEHAIDNSMRVWGRAPPARPSRAELGSCLRSRQLWIATSRHARSRIRVEDRAELSQICRSTIAM